MRETYEKLSNSELLEIIKNPQGYHESAIKLVKEELDSRNLDENDLQTAAEEITQRKIRENYSPVKEFSAKRIKPILLKLLNIFNPIGNHPDRSRRIVNSISLVLSILIIYDLIKEIDYLSFLMNDEYINIHEISIIVMIYLFMISAVITFFKKFKIGWILINLLAYSIVIETLLNTIFLVFYIRPSYNFEENLLFYTEPKIYILSIIFYIVLIITLNTKIIKEYFNINKKLSFTVNYISILLTLLYYYFLQNY